MTVAAARKPRARRVAADEAHSWARNLRLRNPYAKLVLCMLTQYVNGDGACFVGIPTLAEDCELALETVRRRLAWLESVGAIARFPQWLDENGKRNTDGRGKRTTDDIRLLLTADPDDIEARACGDVDADDHMESEPVSPLPGRGLNDHPAIAENAVRTPLGLQQPPHCGGDLDSSEQEPEDSPQAPQGGLRDDARNEQGEQQSEHEVEGWLEFKAEFEADGNPIVRVSIAKTLFEALTRDQRQRVTKAAKGLLAKRAREKKPGSKPSAQTFLRETDAWDAFAKIAPPDPVTKLKIARGSTEYQAATVYWLLVARVPLQSSEADLPQKLVTSPAFLALAQFAEIPREQWIALDADRHDDKAKIGAWRERIKDWSGTWPELEKVPVLDETGAPKVIVKEHTTGSGETMKLKFPVTQDGLRVPAAWPPRQDGSWPESHFAKTG